MMNYGSVTGTCGLNEQCALFGYHPQQFNIKVKIRWHMILA